MKLRSARKFVTGSAAIIFLLWVAVWAYPRLRLSNFGPPPVIPGKINVVAVHKGSGYRIIVSNGIAHLVEVLGSEENFDAPDESQITQESARLPIRETLQSLQGNADALGKMVMAVNKIREDDLPTVKVIWKSEDIAKALAGDAKLTEKLESDLNTHLDGRPLDVLSRDAIINGIVIDSPVTVKVPIEGVSRPITCRIQEPYKSLFAASIENKVNERFDISREALMAYYRDEANKLLGKARKEDVAGSLRSRIDPAGLQQKAEAPERILANTKVIVTEKQMSGASYVTYEGPNRSILSDVTLRLTENGRMRLWKYSHDYPGFQLLLTVDGVAIAAPRIKTELADTEVKLTRVPSKEQVVDAVAFINKTATGSKQK